MIASRWIPGTPSYLEIWQAMRDFTEARGDDTPDEIWLVEHGPVYTLGQAGKPEHILNSGSIPVVKCDRGGQVTYHGPGQLTAYCLVDLRRRGIFVKEYVAMLEDVLIDLLGELGVEGACRKAGAPGVYVPMVSAPVADGAVDGSEGAQTGMVPAGSELAKIAALGIKVRNGRAYHGLALNVDMDLSPFLGINPCGYEGLKTVDLRSCGIRANVYEIGQLLAERLSRAIQAASANLEPHHEETA